MTVIFSDINNLIVRKKYDNFLKNGVIKMDYKLSNENFKKAVDIINNEEINERLIVLKNQLAFIGDTSTPVIENTTLTEEESNNIKNSMNQINESIDVLNFRKTTLEAQLEQALSSFDIGSAVNIKQTIANIDSQINKKQAQNNELKTKIESSNCEYDNQMIKLREKYDNVNLQNLNIEENYSVNAIADFKKEKAAKMVNQFLHSLPQDKKEQILNENEDLKGYANVGENI